MLLAPGMVLTVEPGAYPAGGQRRRSLLEHRDPHRGRRAGDRRRRRQPDGGNAEIRRRCRSRVRVTHDVVIVGAQAVGATLALRCVKPISISS
jgi:hypothetical protein